MSDFLVPRTCPDGTCKFSLVGGYVGGCVGTYVSSGPTALTVWYFFLIFCMKLGLHTTLNDIKKFFGRKNFLTPKMAKNGQNLAIFGQNSRFWVFLAYNFQTPLWIFLIFGMEVVLMVFFEKIILYMPGKFWYSEISSF